MNILSCTEKMIKINHESIRILGALESSTVSSIFTLRKLGRENIFKFSLHFQVQWHIYEAWIIKSGVILLHKSPLAALVLEENKYLCERKNYICPLLLWWGFRRILWRPISWWIGVKQLGLDACLVSERPQWFWLNETKLLISIC